MLIKVDPTDKDANHILEGLEFKLECQSEDFIGG